LTDAIEQEGVESLGVELMARFELDEEFSARFAASGDSHKADCVISAFAATEFFPAGATETRKIVFVHWLEGVDPVADCIEVTAHV
jgi:hypothetical protein